jgi:hypothetical protein
MVEASVLVGIFDCQDVTDILNHTNCTAISSRTDAYGALLLISDVVAGFAVADFFPHPGD